MAAVWLAAVVTTPLPRAAVVTTPLPRVEWSDAALARAMNARAPTVFIGAAADWPALAGPRQWTPAFLAASVPRDAALHAFTVDAANPTTAIFSLATAPLLPYRGAVPRSEPTTMAEFWAQQPARRRFLKATMRNFHEPSTGALPLALRGTVRPLPLFAALRRGAGPTEEDRRASHDVWMSSAGVQSWPHYDLQHNLYTVLYGAKTFRIAAIASATRFYPTTHARHRQARRRRGIEAIVTLGEGETLYIPPYRVHAGATEASSSRGAIAFSACVASHAERVADALRALRVPLADPRDRPATGGDGGGASARELRSYLEAVALRVAEQLLVSCPASAGFATLARVLVRAHYDDDDGGGGNATCAVDLPPAPPTPAHDDAAAAVEAALASIGSDHANEAHARVETWRVFAAWVEELIAMILGAEHVEAFLRCA